MTHGILETLMRHDDETRLGLHVELGVRLEV